MKTKQEYKDRSNGNNSKFNKKYKQYILDFEKNPKSDITDNINRLLQKHNINDNNNDQNILSIHYITFYKLINNDKIIMGLYDRFLKYRFINKDINKAVSNLINNSIDKVAGDIVKTDKKLVKIIFFLAITIL